MIRENGTQIDTPLDGIMKYYNGNVGIGDDTPVDFVSIRKDCAGETMLRIKNINAAGLVEQMVETDSGFMQFTGFGSAFALLPDWAGKFCLVTSGGPDFKLLNVDFGSGVGDLLFGDLSTDAGMIKTSDGTCDWYLYTNVLHSHPTYGCARKTMFAAAEAVLSGASTTIHVNIPAGAKCIGTWFRVKTLITADGGGASWTATLSGGLTQQIVTGKAFAKNTKANALYDSHASTPIAASEVDIAITPNAGTFTAGEIEAVVEYEIQTDMADAA